MGSLSSGVKPLGTLTDYIAQQGQGTQGPAGDVGSILGGLSGISNLIPGLGSITDTLSALGGAFGLSSLLGGFSGRPSTGPGSATADIQGLAGNTDPVLSLLGIGAGNLGSNIPISAVKAAGPLFGPAFDTARRLEDLLRWGPAGLSDKKLQSLDALTLKNALTQAGNPGQGGNNTLEALQQAYQQGSKYLTPANISLLEQGMGSQGINLLNQVLGNDSKQITGGGGSTASSLLGSLGTIAAAAPLLIAGQNISTRPIEPIRLPDVGDNDDQKNKKKKQQQQVASIDPNILSLMSLMGAF